jgi:hypothetical protein
MENYVAVMPVRFDRNYAIGEIIPGHVLAKGSIKRLVDQKRIAPVPDAGPLPDAESRLEGLVAFMEGMLEVTYEEGRPDIIERAGVCMDGLRGVMEIVSCLGGGNGPDNTPPDSNPPVAPRVFICPECHKEFANRAGLTNHIKTHSK